MPTNPTSATQFPPDLAAHLRAEQPAIAQRWLDAITKQALLPPRIARRLPADQAVRWGLECLLQDREEPLTAWLQYIARLAPRLNVTVAQAMDIAGLFCGEIAAVIDHFYADADRLSDEIRLSHTALALGTARLCRLAADAFHRAHNRQLELALARLADSQARYSALVEYANDLVLQSDAEGRFVFVNHRVHDVLGYHPDEMIGRPFSDFMTPESARRAEQMFEEGRHIPGHTTVITLDFVKKGSRETVPLEISRVAFHDRSGRFRGAMGVGRDVSAQLAERAARERQLQLRAIVGTVMGANHEINNPLASILTHVEVIRQRVDPDNAEVQASLDAIAVQARRIADFTQRLRETAEPAFVEYQQHIPMLDLRNSHTESEPEPSPEE